MRCSGGGRRVLLDPIIPLPLNQVTPDAAELLGQEKAISPLLLNGRFLWCCFQQ
jgi:hypothetical protein